MIELKYKNWDEISVNVFKRLTKSVENAEVTGNEYLDLLNKQIAILSVLCGVSEDDIADLSTGEFNKLVKQTDFLNTQPKKNIINKVKLNGKDYEIFLNIQNMTIAQYVDFQTLYPQREKKFSEILSIFIIPKGKSYGEGYDVLDVINDIGEYLPITDANNIMFFFALAYQSLTKVMLTSLKKDMKKMLKKEKNREQVAKIQMAIEKIQEAIISMENGDGYTM